MWARGVRRRALRAAGVQAFGAEFLAEKVRQQLPDVPAGPSSGLTWGGYRTGPLSFDSVFLNEVLEHVPDERAALSEVWRVLAGWGGDHPVSQPLVSVRDPRRHLLHFGRAVPPYVPFVPYVPLSIGRKVFRYWARNYWVHELVGLVLAAGFELRSTGYLWQTFENISGQQPIALTLLRPVLRSVAEVCERLPVIRRLGVSQAIVAGSGSRQAKF